MHFLSPYFRVDVEFTFTLVERDLFEKEDILSLEECHIVPERNCKYDSKHEPRRLQFLNRGCMSC